LQFVASLILQTQRFYAGRQAVSLLGRRVGTCNRLIAAECFNLNKTMLQVAATELDRVN